MATTQEVKQVQPRQYVGIDSLKQQQQQKLLQRGFQFNLMVVGESGLGKTTFVNSLFTGDLLEHRGAQPPPKTTEVRAHSFVLEEGGIKMKLNVIDTPGFADQINNDFCWEPITRYVKDQYAIYLRKELSPQRDKRIADTRIHCILYFIPPTGHSLKPLDIIVMKKLGEISNLVVVIGKSDSLTMRERFAFKDRVKDELAFHGIQVFGGTTILDDLDLDQGERDSVLSYKAMMPFALIGSENMTQEGRVRQYKWGKIVVDDPQQCDFTPLRDFLIRQHLQVFLDSTTMHYEAFRTKQLMALKEASKSQQN